MDIGKLYFINDLFYTKFAKFGLLINKETVDGVLHKRPCCYLFKFEETAGDIYWMIPISSKVEKYEREYQRSVDKYGMCDNISFGYVLGERRAFLVQNLFPVTSEYIDNVYVDKNTNLPITIPNDLMAELNAKARKKIRYNQCGKKLGLSDTVKLYNSLKADIKA